ncbi:MAG: hypothetical protein K2H17_08175 [Duncaniella sp.]|uniref:hypothetical protein n=1 Tax=Duncaniella sp. TaxID=2518496 RepID=UPI0023CC5E0A|nr:hypothetical protein [Duncaniella sp.]MDE5989362.1 hypothetical protein [Duncaniella sp.]
MNFKYKFSALLMAGALMLSGVTFTSCDDDNDLNTNQYVGGVSLNVFGPCPVARGGELRFLGSGMNQIQSVTLPGTGEITDIRVISNTEIRITVPQNAEPGLVTLKYAKGTITTKTPISFTEPISLESFAPTTVKPGDEFTIAGDYLNLIHEVIFSKDVVVSEDDFLAHSRAEIKLLVPAEAQSGKIILSDAAEMPNWIYSEEELVVTLPIAENVLDLTGVKPGNTITVKGADFDLVTKIVMPNGDEVEFTINDEGNELSFVLPANVSNGTIRMVPASGVEIAVATIGVAVPEDVVAEPAADIWAGDVIKLKGLNMELITEVVFPNVEKPVAPETQSATEITLVVPVGTQSGNLILNTASGESVEVAVATLKPEAVGFDPQPAALAGALTVKGRNLQNVASITFAGSTTVEVSNPTSTEFSVTVPATLSAGANAVTLTLTNGESVEVGNVELSAPECAYATELPGEDTEIRAGETFVVTIANADKLTGVQVNGQNVQYILNGSMLIIQVPGSAGKNSNFTLVSSNGSISYDIAVIPATHVGMTIWSGMWENTGWGGNQDLAWGGYDWSQVPEGATLTLYMTPTVAEGEWWCVSLRHADGWGNLPAPIPGQYDNPENGVLSVVLTKEVLADIVACNGLVITGSQFVLNKVDIEWEISLETAIWTGAWDCGAWGGNQDLAWDGYDWSSVKPGQILRFYMTPAVAPGEWWCISLRHGDGWANLPGNVYSQIDTPENNLLEVSLTKEIIDDLVANNGLVITGQGYRLDKVTIE